MLQPLLFRQPGGDEETFPRSGSFVNIFGGDEEVCPQRFADDFNLQSRQKVQKLRRQGRTNRDDLVYASQRLAHQIPAQLRSQMH